jgi:DNA-binding CsgD family transcriptional regulator
MNAFKFGRRYGLLGRRQAAELNSPAKQVRQRALQPHQPCLEKLTRREQDVLKLLTQGFLKKEIAAHLDISEETVRTHTGHIYEKLHVNCRGDAVAKAVPLAALEWLKPGGRSSCQLAPVNQKCKTNENENTFLINRAAHSERLSLNNSAHLRTRQSYAAGRARSYHEIA